MSHSEHIWPALAALRRRELPSLAGVDALVALARGECEAPRQPRLFTDSDGADALAKEWAAAYEAETLLACPALTKVDRSFLASAERSVAGSSQLYGYFHRWLRDPKSPDFCRTIAPTPKGFASQLPRVSAWAGPRIAAERKAQRDRAEVEQAERRERAAPTAEGVAVVPLASITELKRKLAASKGYGPPCSESTARRGGGE